MEGRTISHYSILRKLGAGGMGEVYLAEDTTLSRKVAIKFLSQNSLAGEQSRKRFVREARAAAALDHPHICAVYEVGDEAGYSFIVMQYVEGETLASRIQRQPIEVREALDIAVQIADALAEAHSHRIIHRDVKPQNVMLTASGQVKVLDFGLARVIREGSLIDSAAETESAPGLVIGTVPYMSPEQVRAEHLDARSDIFSFGAVLYEMLCGRSPFQAASAGETMSAILTKDPAPLAETPDEMERIVRKALSKDKEGRYQGIKDLLIDLRALNIQKKKPDSDLKDSKKVRMFALIILVIAISIVVAFVVILTRTWRKEETRNSKISTVEIKASTIGPFTFAVMDIEKNGKVFEQHLRVGRFFTEDLDGSVALEIVEIPSGTFLMGAPDNEVQQPHYDLNGKGQVEQEPSERPQHQVSLPMFYMSRFEVTQAQWRAVAAFPKVKSDLNPDPSKFKGDNLPVEQISWEDAMEFCARLSQKTGRKYRLPSESEWEYACRAGTSTPFAFGHTITRGLVNFFDYDHLDFIFRSRIPRMKADAVGRILKQEMDALKRADSLAKTMPVGNSVVSGNWAVSNAFGLVDMHGNVSEWCLDTLHGNYEGAPTDGSTWEDGEDGYRVTRGGDYQSHPLHCRSAFRGSGVRQDTRTARIGLRVALTRTW
ncbi:MAG TPA: bifunctional serine/threonine-protein kinase/formylglycine-generating enzyme family protein [Blastocatellia bacterium]|nr:bifunctional serine/threonine-protein kinase/formylglycine-generating enzyme family protein [Blastocatellia bacterium]